MPCQQVVLLKRRENWAPKFVHLSVAWKVLAGDGALENGSLRGQPEVIFKVKKRGVSQL